MSETQVPAPSDVPSKAPQAIWREDYRPPAFVIDRVELRFELEEEVSLVHATLALRRAEGAAADAPLVLDGEQLILRSAAIDGRPLAATQYVQDAETLTIAGGAGPLRAAHGGGDGCRTTPS